MKIKITGIDWFLLKHELIYDNGKTSKIWFRLIHRKENLDLLDDMDIKLVHTIKCIEQ